MNAFYPKAFWGALALIVGLVMGQYSPNRNIVTTDQLDKSTQVLQTQIVALQSQVAANAAADALANQTTNESLQMLHGELKGRKLVDQ